MNSAVKSLLYVGPMLAVIGVVIAFVAGRQVEAERMAEYLGAVDANASTPQGWVTFGIVLAVAGVAALIVFLAFRARTVSRTS